MSVERSLHFVDSKAQQFVRVIEPLLQDGARKIWFAEWDRKGARIWETLHEAHPDLELLRDAGGADDAEWPTEARPASPDEAEVAVLLNSDGERISSQLMAFVDRSRVHVVAPYTKRYFLRQPLFLITVPKAGTHLLYQLVKAFGYGMGVDLNHRQPKPGVAYCIEYSNSHTVARDFFVDTVRRSPFGNRHHAFSRSPALLIYRNPLDVVVSEANYYHKEGATAFFGYFAGMDFPTRLRTLIRDPFMLGSIRDRIGGFAPWLNFPNVAPMSFEELVGSNGGGSDAVQEDLIWSLQLKLHVPGSPRTYGERVFDRESPTFHAGQIGNYRKYFDAQAYALFGGLDQDFMRAFGYAGEDLRQAPSLPGRAEEFRRRPLTLSRRDFAQTPILEEAGYLGFNLIRFRGEFLALPEELGPFDLLEASSQALALLPRAPTLAHLKNTLLVGPRKMTQIAEWRRSGLVESVQMSADATPDALADWINREAPYGLAQEAPVELVESRHEHNIVAIHGLFWAVRQGLVPDWTQNLTELKKCCFGDDFFFAPSLETIRWRLDHRRQEQALVGRMERIEAEVEQRQQPLGGRPGEPASSGGLNEAFARLEGEVAALRAQVTEKKTSDLSVVLTELAQGLSAPGEEPELPLKTLFQFVTGLLDAAQREGVEPELLHPLRERLAAESESLARDLADHPRVG